MEEADYLGIGTLESFQKMKKYYGESSVVPIYIEVENGERLTRALKREKKQEVRLSTRKCAGDIWRTRYDFSEENVLKAGIWKRFENIDLDECVQEIKQEIKCSCSHF